ncbi:hypothetical protein B0F90DRAFT_341247 [Multifurca ochricompacta]|uniref:Uncharacterized protein n=1 Tax=Multifurca ochricompacta TaxID=376703 RepID=A0AAD4LW14_9AGAM|nr:hypothetical protein B0F90DRAFT_341247 [Multifurca ochricompacta]
MTCLVPFAARLAYTKAECIPESKEAFPSSLRRDTKSWVSFTMTSVQNHRRTDTSGKDENRVLGGYKATLKNPNVGEEAKERHNVQSTTMESAMTHLMACKQRDSVLT